MGAWLRKYGTGTGSNIGIPMIVASSSNYAVGANWTPATGDVKISKDGATQANIGTLPSYSEGDWVFVFSDAELQCKRLSVRIVDSATKAVEDNGFNVETYGHASAMLVQDLSAAQYAGNVTQWSSTNVATPDTPGYPVVTNKFGTGAGEMLLIAGVASVNLTYWRGEEPDALNGTAVNAFVQGIGSGVIAQGSFESGAITSAAIDDNAITAAKLHADVAAELRAAIGLGSANLDTQLSGISAKTNSLTFTVANHLDVNVLKVGGQNATATGAVDFDDLGSGSGGGNKTIVQRGRVIVQR